MLLLTSLSLGLRRIGQVLYLSLLICCFYLLLISRTGETRTVWQVLNPAFIPILLATTFFLFTTLFTTQKTSSKLLFVIFYSVLIHALFSVLFPAGDLSGQQTVLGETRRVFDNTILHGLSGWPTATVGIFIVEAFKGVNLQAALTTILARMLAIDIFYVHLSFIPILWGVFVPIASFLIAQAIGANEKAAVLSSLLISAFPYSIYFGAISVPNSLGFIFFFYSLYFMLKHLSSNDSRNVYWALAFSLFSFLSHYLTGIVSLSLLLLTVAFKAFESEKVSAPTSSRILLASSFLICVSILPLSFIYLRFLGTSAYPAFTLDKILGTPIHEVVGTLIIGVPTSSFGLQTLLSIVGPLLGFLLMIHLMYSLRKDPNAKFRQHISLLFTAFLIILVDAGVLNLFMTGLPIEQPSLSGRLQVLRDFVAVPFVALAVYVLFSALKTLQETKLPQITTASSLKALSKGVLLRALSLLIILNVLIPIILSGWITLSVGVAYPHAAQLQLAWYELEAARYIKESCRDRYVVIGDLWTIYAGEMIVGINNPQSYYFGEFSKTGHDLFVNMTKDPSSKWMLLAMNYTDTTVAYFVITQPRLGAEQFDAIVSNTLKNEQLALVGVFGAKKLYVFSYRKG